MAFAEEGRHGHGLSLSSCELNADTAHLGAGGAPSSLLETGSSRSINPGRSAARRALSGSAMSAMERQQQQPMAMVTADFGPGHEAWDAGLAEGLLQVSAGSAVRMLDGAEPAIMGDGRPSADFCRVGLVGGQEGLVPRGCVLATATGGKGDWAAAAGEGGRGGGEPADASIKAAVDKGLSGANFDMSENVAKGDEREVDPALFAMEAIMEREGCDFDAARLIYNQEKMREAGIDPETGLSIDPKAVTNPDDFERVFAGPASDGLGARLRTKVEQTAAWWRRQSELFGFGFVAFISVANFLFGMIAEWYNIFLAYYLKDDLHMSAAMTQTIGATAGLAYQLRPICGLVSDSFPLLGSTRHSWWFFASMVAVLSQSLLLVVDDVTLTTALLFAVNFFGEGQYLLVYLHRHRP